MKLSNYLQTHKANYEYEQCYSQASVFFESDSSSLRLLRTSEIITNIYRSILQKLLLKDFAYDALSLRYAKLQGLWPSLALVFMRNFWFVGMKRARYV